VRTTTTAESWHAPCVGDAAAFDTLFCKVSGTYTIYCFNVGSQEEAPRPHAGGFPKVIAPSEIQIWRAVRDLALPDRGQSRRGRGAWIASMAVFADTRRTALRCSPQRWTCSRVCVRAQDGARDRSKSVDALSSGSQGGAVLRYFQDLSVEEISEVLGCSVAAAKVRLHRGVRCLRIILWRFMATMDWRA